MVERKLFKTKLCVLYKRGHCPRQSCSFAHGDAELRRYSGSFNDRRDYRGGDLRVTLDRRHSPLRRYSPRRDARGRQVFRESSPSRSPGRNSDQKHKRRQRLDDHSDYSSSLKISDGIGDRHKRKRNTSFDSRYAIEEQLKQVQLDIEKREDHKCQLQISLEERIQEADTLTSRIQELESQLHNEKEDCYRITSKIKKFVRAQNRHTRIQDELKRSQIRLQKLGHQLGSDATRLGANEDDLSIDIVSDGEPIVNDSPYKKKQRAGVEGPQEAKTGKFMREGARVGAMRLDKKSSRLNARFLQQNEMKEAEYESSDHRSVAYETKHKMGDNVSTAIPFAKKAKEVESGVELPATGMAAHAGDEYNDFFESQNEKIDLVETLSENGGGASSNDVHKIPNWSLPLPPPPPIPQNAYSQFKGEDQNVDVDVDADELEEEMVDVDIV